MRLTVLQELVQFGLAYNGVDDIRGTQSDIEIREIVLMQQRGVQRRNHHDVHVREIVLQHQAVMRLFADGNWTERRRGILQRETVGRRWRLRSQQGADQPAEHRGAKHKNGWFHGVEIVRCQKSHDKLNAVERWTVTAEVAMAPCRYFRLRSFRHPRRMPSG